MRNKFFPIFIYCFLALPVAGGNISLAQRDSTMVEVTPNIIGRAANKLDSLSEIDKSLDRQIEWKLKQRNMRAERERDSITNKIVDSLFKQ